MLLIGESLVGIMYSVRANESQHYLSSENPIKQAQNMTHIKFDAGFSSFVTVKQCFIIQVQRLFQ